MPAKSDDNTDKDYDAKTHRVCQRVSIKTDKQCIYLDVCIFMCQLTYICIYINIY